MRFINLRYLSGPNVFSTSPVSVARLELDELTGKETTDFAGFAARLAALLPGLAAHHCAAGRRAVSWTRWPAAPTSAT